MTPKILGGSRPTRPDGRTSSKKSHRRSKAGAAGAFVDDYLPALLARASHLISGEFHRVVSAHGLSVSNWRVLGTLAGGKPLSIGRIAEITVMKQPTLTRVLDRMEASGHVKRIASDGDRRVTLVAITPAGEQLVEGLITLAREHERRVLEPFGLARTAELKSTLKRMIELHKDLPDLPDEADDSR